MEPQIIDYYSRSFSNNGEKAVEEFLKFLEDYFKGKFIVNLCGSQGIRYYSIFRYGGRKQILIIEDHNKKDCHKGLLTYPINKGSITNIHTNKLNWSDVFKGQRLQDPHRRKFDYRGKSYSELEKILNHFL